MMKVYGKVNTNEQLVTAMRAPEGYIEMQSLRPSINHIAMENGSWLYVEPALTPDFPIGETDKLIQDYGSLGWGILSRLGVE